jgi:hypothetical protein
VAAEVLGGQHEQDGTGTAISAASAADMDARLRKIQELLEGRGK